ncbi:MAG: hypothetical protein ABSG51_07915 [Terracidiphilus sp.]|jgi:hypothetical protein
MNISDHNPLHQSPGHGGADAGGFEKTLRLIAHLPAPEGLEERVRTGLRDRRLAGTARVLDFPAALRPGSDWMRSAAAAAIVFVVVGGGWGIYSRVQQPQGAKVIAMPARVASPGGFSNSGAMQLPKTLNGPVVVLPVTPKPAEAPAQATKKVNRKAAAGAGKTLQPVASEK